MDSRENDCSPLQLCWFPGSFFFNYKSDNRYKKVWVIVPCMYKAQCEDIFLAANLAKLANLANVLKFVLLLPLAPQFANLSKSFTSSALLGHWTLKVNFLLIVCEQSSRIIFALGFSGRSDIGIDSKLCPHLAVNMTQCPEDVWVSGGKAIWQWAMSQRPLEVSSIDNKRHPLNGCGDIRVLKAVVQSHHMVWSGSLPRLQPTPSTRPHVYN